MTNKTKSLYKKNIRNKTKKSAKKSVEKSAEIVNKTFSISKPPFKIKYYRSPYLNIKPVYYKLIEYGLKNIELNGNTHIHVELSNNCEMSIIYLNVGKEYFLETYIYPDTLAKLTKKQEKKIYKCYGSIDEVKKYKSIKELYDTIVKLDKCII